MEEEGGPPRGGGGGGLVADGGMWGAQVKYQTVTSTKDVLVKEGGYKNLFRGLGLRVG